MVANAIAAGYLVLSLPFSAVIVLRPQAIGLRHLLLVCDLVSLPFSLSAGTHPSHTALHTRRHAADQLISR